MTIYDNPLSRSFIELCPRSLRFHEFKLLFLKKKKTRPFEAKFHMKPPCDYGMKMYSNVSGHMTKMASRPIYGKNLQTSSSEPRGRWSWNIGYSSTTKFIQRMTLGWPWPFSWHGQICFLMLLHMWKLMQHNIRSHVFPSSILCTQMSDPGPLVLWLFNIHTAKVLVILNWSASANKNLLDAMRNIGIEYGQYNYTIGWAFVQLYNHFRTIVNVTHRNPSWFCLW